MTQPLRSTRITRLHPYYELLRPCAPHRYAGSCGANHLSVSLHIGTTGSHVPRKSPEQRHATSTPDTAQPIHRLPLDSSRITTQDPVLMSSVCAFDASAVIRLRSSRCSIPATFIGSFSLTLTTTTLDRSSSGRFDASPCRATPEGLPLSVLELRHGKRPPVYFVPRGTRCGAQCGWWTIAPCY